MELWELALKKFLEPWEHNENVIGILVCGSFITGQLNKHSDIDVHIVLSENTLWRERGNVIIDNYLIEYFVNPPSQIRAYFQNDFNNYAKNSLVQFITGKVLLDKDGIVTNLKENAQDLFNKPFPIRSDSIIESDKYFLWDLSDNLQVAFEEDSPSFSYFYHNALTKIIDIYRKYLGYDVLKPDKVLKIFVDENYRKKYLLDEFPDQSFIRLIVQAITTESKTEMRLLYDKLTEYVINKLGGLQINGWKLRSPVNI